MNTKQSTLPEQKEADFPAVLHLKILIADDDEQSQRMMQFILQRSGYDVQFALNGVDAVQKVKAGEFDLVLMDVQMPLLSGLDATRQIREWEAGQKRVAIFGLTAILDSEYEACLQAGMDAIISKPFDTKEFFAAIQELAKNKETLLAGSSPQVVSQPARVLDVAGAVKRFAGDQAYYVELLAEFILSLDGKWEDLQKEYAAENWEVLANRVHNLKGLSANFGAVGLAQRARDLELAIRNDHAQVQEKLTALEAGIHDVRSAASVYLRSLSGEESTS